MYIYSPLKAIKPEPVGETDERVIAQVNWCDGDRPIGMSLSWQDLPDWMTPQPCVDKAGKQASRQAGKLTIFEVSRLC